MKVCDGGGGGGGDEGIDNVLPTAASSDHKLLLFDLQDALSMLQEKYPLSLSFGTSSPSSSSDLRSCHMDVDVSVIFSLQSLVDKVNRVKRTRTMRDTQDVDGLVNKLCTYLNSLLERIPMSNSFLRLLLCRHLLRMLCTGRRLPRH